MVRKERFTKDLQVSYNSIKESGRREKEFPLFHVFL